jgi:hypothetical protein
VTQLPLFDLEAPVRRHVRRAGSIRAHRVQYEPAVSEVPTRKDRLGCDLRSAFASFWARLSPEQRAELRGRLAA